MGAFTSKQLDLSSRAQYDYALRCTVTDLEVLYKCKLPESTLLECDAELVPIQVRGELTSTELAALDALFKTRERDIHRILATWFYSAYPVVCDVSSDITARLLRNKASDLFDVYLTIGGYLPLASGTYHAWVTVVGHASKCPCYVDLTYVQFDCEWFRNLGHMNINCGHEYLRELAARGSLAAKLPDPIITPTSSKWGLFEPISFARVL